MLVSGCVLEDEVNSSSVWQFGAMYERDHKTGSGVTHP